MLEWCKKGGGVKRRVFALTLSGGTVTYTIVDTLVQAKAAMLGTEQTWWGSY